MEKTEKMRELIANLRNEVETTMRCSLALKQFRITLGCSECVEKINQNALFWKTYEGSLKTNMFIGLRRLFDGGQDTFNFRKVISECKEHLNEFSKSALRKRKINGSSNASEWIDSYMIDVYEPTEKDFNNLLGIVDKQGKKIKKSYLPVATKVFAHAIDINYEVANEKMKKLSFDEIEETLHAIWHVYEEIWDFLENGREPALELRKYRYEQEIYDAVEKQIGCRCNK